MVSHKFDDFGQTDIINPPRFQSVKGDSAQASGVKQIALVISVSLTIVASGAAVAALGYYNPFLLLGTVLASIGAGLLYTINIDSGLGELYVRACSSISLEQPTDYNQTVLGIRSCSG